MSRVGRIRRIFRFFVYGIGLFIYFYKLKGFFVLLFFFWRFWSLFVVNFGLYTINGRVLYLFGFKRRILLILNFKWRYFLYFVSSFRRGGFKYKCSFVFC